jgi:hypothetical protein
MAEPVPGRKRSLSRHLPPQPVAATSSRSARSTMLQARPRYRRLPRSTQRANTPHQSGCPHRRRAHRRFGRLGRASCGDRRATARPGEAVADVIRPWRVRLWIVDLDTSSLASSGSVTPCAPTQSGKPSSRGHARSVGLEAGQPNAEDLSAPLHDWSDCAG